MQIKFIGIYNATYYLILVDIPIDLDQNMANLTLSRRFIFDKRKNKHINRQLLGSETKNEYSYSDSCVNLQIIKGHLFSSKTLNVYKFKTFQNFQNACFLFFSRSFGNFIIDLEIIFWDYFRNVWVIFIYIRKGR